MSPSTRRKMAFLLTACVSIAVVVVAMAWLSGAFRRDRISPGLQAAPATAPAGPTVEVQSVKRPIGAYVVGTIESDMRTTVASRLTASINSISVNAGDRVRKDDVLIRLDDRDIKARVAQARESLRSAEASRDLAKREVDRLVPLLEKQVATPNEVDTWQTKYQGASADVIRAQRFIEEAEVQLSDTVLKAPFDGVVIDRQAEPGDLASPGKSLLTLYDPSRMRLEASVREAYIGRLDQLRQAKQPLTVVVHALNKELQGTVSQIVPAADPESRSFLVKIQLTDSSSLYPGMFARLLVPMGPEEVVEIPANAVREVGQLALVNVVDDHGSATRAIRLGSTHDGRVEVLAGLSAGERIAIPR